jgi:hypothetical protein
MRQLYQARLEDWRQEIRATCQRRGAHHLAVSTGQPWDEVVFQEMRATGVVK